MKLKKKLCSRRGETLVETLVAVLVVALTSAALAGMLGAASRINTQVIREDERLYAGLQAVQTGKTPEGTDLPTASGSVLVSIEKQNSVQTVETPVTVTIRSDNGLVSYQEELP